MLFVKQVWMPLFLLTLAAYNVLAKDEPKCEFKDPETKKVYDLSSLMLKDGGKDYEVKIPADPDHEQDEATFALNICHSILTSNSGVKNPDDVGAILKGKKESDKSFSLGKVNDKIYKIGQHLVLDYEEGDSCSELDLKRKTTRIVFTCSSQAKEPTVQYLSQFHNCNYMFEVLTDKVCGDGISPPSSSEGSSFSIWNVIWIAITLYLLGGVLYNRFIAGKQGLEQIPHFEFWYNCYDFVKDMTIILLVKAVDFFKSLANRSGNRYSSVPRGDNPIMVGDDDDDTEL